MGGEEAENLKIEALKACIGVLTFIIGSVVGSFLNVCIYRLPRRMSLVKPASHCPSCKTPILRRDNIPLVSCLILRGRCRHCRSGISPRYPVVEFLTACLFLLIFLEHGMGPKAVVYWLLTSLLVVASFIDVEHGIIPDVVTLPGAATGLLLTSVLKILPVWEPVLGLAAGGGSLAVVGLSGRAILRRESMGWGDVKLAGMVGAFLGWQSTLLSLLVAFGTGALIGVVLLAIRRTGPHRQMPFGPFISLGAVTLLLAQDAVLSAVFSLHSP